MAALVRGESSADRAGSQPHSSRSAAANPYPTWHLITHRPWRLEMTAALTQPVCQPARMVTVRPAPRREPPFDDERPYPHVALVGRHDRHLPFDAPQRRVVDVHQAFAARRINHGGLPDPEAFGRRLLVGIFEALGGRRSLPQLAAHLSHGVYRGLVNDVERPGRRRWHEPPAIRSVRICEPAGEVAELSAVIQTGRRCRAVALRLEGANGRWRCVRLQIG
jgi:Family of unknown function (DUF6459)